MIKIKFKVEEIFDIKHKGKTFVRKFNKSKFLLAVKENLCLTDDNLLMPMISNDNKKMNELANHLVKIDKKLPNKFSDEMNEINLHYIVTYHGNEKSECIPIIRIVNFEICDSIGNHLAIPDNQVNLVFDEKTVKIAYLKKYIQSIYREGNIKYYYETLVDSLFNLAINLNRNKHKFVNGDLQFEIEKIKYSIEYEDAYPICNITLIGKVSYYFCIGNLYVLEDFTKSIQE